MKFIKNLFAKSKTKEQIKKEEFDALLTYKDMRAINYFENAHRKDPIVLRSTFNRDLYHKFLLIRRS